MTNRTLTMKATVKRTSTPLPSTVVMDCPTLDQGPKTYEDLMMAEAMRLRATVKPRRTRLPFRASAEA